MQNPKKESAKRRALRRLKNMYPNDFQELYKQELNTEISVIKKKTVGNEDVTTDGIEFIIAKSLMNTRYLSALMQDIGGKR